MAQGGDIGSYRLEIRLQRYAKLDLICFAKCTCLDGFGETLFFLAIFTFFGGQKDLFLEAWSDFQDWGCPAKLLEIALGKYEAGLSEILTGDHRCSPISE